MVGAGVGAERAVVAGAAASVATVTGAGPFNRATSCPALRKITTTQAKITRIRPTPPMRIAFLDKSLLQRGQPLLGTAISG